MSTETMKQSEENIKSSLLSQGTASTEDVTSVIKQSTNTLTELGSKIDSLNCTQSKKTELKNKLQDIKNSTFGKTTTNKTLTSQTTTIGSRESDDYSNLTREEAMSYDDNGMKHFMNIFIQMLDSEKIEYTKLGSRRWAVDKDDNKVFGNAFVHRQTSKTYKTLDSDGKLYWLNDYNSRHYYGEAIDITPASSAILEQICLSEKILDVMQRFGICIQYEVSESGHSKGTHFHCSTDSDNPQSKWWGIVNQIRQSKGKNKLYPILLKSEYFEEETKNTLVNA